MRDQTWRQSRSGACRLPSRPLVIGGVLYRNTEHWCAEATACDRHSAKQRANCCSAEAKSRHWNWHPESPWPAKPPRHCSARHIEIERRRFPEPHSYPFSHYENELDEWLPLARLVVEVCSAPQMLTRPTLWVLAPGSNPPQSSLLRAWPTGYRWTVRRRATKRDQWQIPSSISGHWFLPRPS